MRCLVLLFPLALIGCAKPAVKTEAAALQDRAAESSGGALGKGCPWTTIEAARVDAHTIWLDDSPWVVESDAAAEAFADLLAVCGPRTAEAPFRVWRSATVAHEEQTARSSSSTGQIEPAASGPQETDQAGPSEAALSSATEALVRSLTP